MVIGMSPTSSKIQKRIRETISTCKNAINIKDDILIFGKGQDHDQHLKEVLTILQDKGLTFHHETCLLGQPEVKLFGNIYSKHGMSPNLDKCKIIREWPQPQSRAEVKSFVQTIQFDAKFLCCKPGEASYPEVTEPLHNLIRKNTKFAWGPEQTWAFNELKNHLCSDDAYDTQFPTRLHVNSSPVGTQATFPRSIKSTMRTIGGQSTTHPGLGQLLKQAIHKSSMKAMASSLVCT